MPMIKNSTEFLIKLLVHFISENFPSILKFSEFITLLKGGIEMGPSNYGYYTVKQESKFLGLLAKIFIVE